MISSRLVTLGWALALSLLLGACAGGGSSRSSGRSALGTLDSGDVQGDGVDRRILWWKCRERFPFVLVSETHSLRQPEVRPKGPRQLTQLGPNRRVDAYRVLPEAVMKDLIKQFDDAGYGSFTRAATPADGRFFDARQTNAKSLDGVLIIEEGGRRRILLSPPQPPLRPGTRGEFSPPRDAFRVFRSLCLVMRRQYQTDERPGSFYVNRASN